MKISNKGWSLLSGDNKIFEQKNNSVNDLSVNFARCFNTKDGKVILNYLKSITLERAMSPETQDSVLRHIEGQRALVNQIINMTKRGMEK